jgi:hypothetical protein
MSASIVDRFGAIGLARSAAVGEAGNESLVGELLFIEELDDRISSYTFESLHNGYMGWTWLVTIAKLEDGEPTICDSVMAPGEEALLAPEWIPYAERLQPGDLKVGDIIPTAADDQRLVPGYAALPDDEELDLIDLFEVGLGRARVLSVTGRDLASKRWYEGDRGPNTPIAQSAPKPCASCGFYIPLSGSLRKAFGVCSNLLSPEDARVVSVDHGCGAHSEALIR